MDHDRTMRKDPPLPSVRDVARLSFAALGGAFAWATHFLVSYILVSIACVSSYFAWNLLGIDGLILVILLVTLASLGVTLWATRVAYDVWKQPTVGREPNTEEKRERNRYIGLAGLLLNMLHLFLIVFETIPIFMLRPCG